MVTACYSFVLEVEVESVPESRWPACLPESLSFMFCEGLSQGVRVESSEGKTPSVDLRYTHTCTHSHTRHTTLHRTAPYHTTPHHTKKHNQTTNTSTAAPHRSHISDNLWSLPWSRILKSSFPNYVKNKWNFFVYDVCMLRLLCSYMYSQMDILSFQCLNTRKHWVFIMFRD